MKPVLKYYGPTILWALFVLFICCANLGSAGHSPMFFEGFDKVTHTGLFFTLVVLYCNSKIRQQKPRPFSYTQALVVIVSAVIFGAIIEILQLYIFTWRNAEWSDLFCDTLGTCMAIFGVMLTKNAIGNEKN